MSPTNTEWAKLTCPFYRFDPHFYKACSAKQLNSWDTLTKHIQRKHAEPEFYSPLCCKCFGKADEWAQHVNTPTCLNLPRRDWITKEEWKAAKTGKEKYPRGDPIEKWMWLWDSFFGDFPKPQREEVYFRGDDQEAKHASIDLSIIQSVLQTAPALGQHENMAWAEKIHKALLLGKREARRYRVDPGRPIRGDNNGAIVDSGAPLQSRPVATESFEIGVPNTDAELLQPVAEYLTAPPQSRASILQEEQRLAATEDPSTHHPTEGSASPILQTDSVPASASIPLPVNHWSVDMMPWKTADDFLAQLKDKPISGQYPAGLKWSDVWDHIDMDRFKEDWKPGKDPRQLFEIPIRTTHAQGFCEKITALEKSGTSWTGSAFGCIGRCVDDVDCYEPGSCQ